MTTRDELREQLMETLLSGLSADDLMPEIDAYVAEKLAEQQEVIATRIEANCLRILGDDPYVERSGYVDGVVTTLSQTAAWVRDFGTETT